MKVFQIVKEKLDEAILDFAFFSSEKVIDNASRILIKLLEEEKEKFYKKLACENEKVTFDDLEDESTLSTFFWLIEHFNSVDTSDDLRKIIEDFEPVFVAWENEISYNKRYFEILQKILEKWNLDEDQTRIITEAIKSYKIRWIDLPVEKQEELKKINQEVAELQQKFSNNMYDAEREFSYLFENESVISEMPEDDKRQAKIRAAKQWKNGYLFDALRWNYSLVTTYCTDREIRKLFYTEKNKFASQWKYDNREIVLNILKLRDKKAKLLWYENYASYGFEYKMAESPKQVIDLILETVKSAKEKAIEEVDILKKFSWLEDFNYWDLAYYIRKYKEQNLHFEEKKLKPYFEFEATLQWLFQLVSQLFWVELVEIEWEENHKYDPEVRLYEVKRGGITMAYFVWDYFQRKWKRDGAWANDLRPKFLHNWKNKLPIIVNVANFQKNEWEKTMLLLRDVETMFHEFGHALHGMLSVSKYSELSGFWVEWDFVEFPSQLMENWCRDKVSLDLFARHFETWELIPQELLDAMKVSDLFWKWIFLTRQNEFSYMDMRLHTSQVPESVDELDEVIAKVNWEVAIFSRWPEYKQYTTFHYAFDGGYAAGYYSYMWAEIIEAQVWQMFQTDNVISSLVGKKYYDIVLAQWSRKDAMYIFKELVGGEIELRYFLERYGIKK